VLIIGSWKTDEAALNLVVSFTAQHAAWCHPAVVRSKRGPDKRQLAVKDEGAGEKKKRTVGKMPLLRVMFQSAVENHSNRGSAGWYVGSELVSELDMVWAN